MADAFCERFGLTLPVIEAPMAGACTPQRSGAIADAGGMGSLIARQLWAEALELLP